MHPRAVPLVLAETILRIVDIQTGHQPVPGDLCQDRCGGDAQGAGIPFGQRSLGQRDVREEQMVDQDMVGLGGELLHRPLHGQPGGREDPKVIDLLRAGIAHTPGQRTGLQARFPPGPLSRSHGF